MNGGGKKQEGTWQKKNDMVAGRKGRGGEADGSKEAEQRERAAELQENGGCHFSLHMHQRLGAAAESSTDVESARRKQKTAETKINIEPKVRDGGRR